jgi:hypothetical protein
MTGDTEKKPAIVSERMACIRLAGMTGNPAD